MVIRIVSDVNELSAVEMLVVVMMVMIGVVLSSLRWCNGDGYRNDNDVLC